MQRSTKLLKEAAKATAISDLATPSQAFLMLSWSRLWHSSPHFGFLKLEIVCWRHVRRIGRVLKPLDAMGVEPTGDHSGGVHTRIIPVEKPLLGHHLRPFQLQILYSMGSRKRPGVNPRSSATAAAIEAMKIAERTVFLRRRWRAQWRAPCLLNNSVSSSGPRRQLPRFF